MPDADRCACCGEIIPEGRQVCPECEGGAEKGWRASQGGHMTVKEMSQLYHLNREIEQLQQQLENIEAQAFKMTQTPSDSPRTPGASDKVGRYAVAIADLKDKIKNRKTRCWDELNRLNEYIDGVDDSLTRQILTLRFVNGLSWQQVADCIGSSEYSVKHICYRYLDGH